MRRKALVLVLALAAGLSACAPAAPKASNLPAKPAPLPAQQAEALCRSFVERALTSEGGAFTNYLTTESAEPLTSGHEVLSESQGLLLCYYAAAADRAGFDKTLAFIRDRLDTGELLSYRLRTDGSVFPVNAAVDDLRILRGLLAGAEAFSDNDYRALCGGWAERLLKTNTADGFLLDFYDGDYRTAGRLCTLCYADFYTLRLLGARDADWLTVDKTMLDIVLGGYLGEAFPFFRTRWLPDEQAYSSGSIRTAEALLTALHLSEIGACPGATVAWVKRALAEGAVYGEYTQAGKPMTAVESTAVYALCALLGISENEPALVQAAVEKLSSYQVTDENSALYGAFGNAETEEAFSFDNLMALNALRAQTEFFAGKEEGAAA